MMIHYVASQQAASERVTHQLSACNTAIYQLRLGLCVACVTQT